MAIQSGRIGTAKLILVIVACAAAGLGARQQPTPAASDSLTPVIDHHQHLFSPAVHKISPTLPPMNAAELAKLLDEAGIQRAAVLSLGYQYGNPNRPPVTDEYSAVKAENDWTAAQIAPFGERLRGFCGLNPLKPYAVEEISRCAQIPQLRFGLKLHFGNSDVDLTNADHVKTLQRVFAAANERRMAIVVHMRSSVTAKRPYGAPSARAFLNDVLSFAPDVPVQIAHLAGAGGYDDPAIDDALAVFVDAIANRDPRMKNVYFDASGVTGVEKPTEKLDLVATRIRQIGVDRVLYGSDGALPPAYTPKKAWEAFRRLALTDAEFKIIANNRAPYMEGDHQVLDRSQLAFPFPTVARTRGSGAFVRLLSIRRPSS
jgi:predicted TIM-barrel fold metal-dependent hydrolase